MKEEGLSDGGGIGVAGSGHSGPAKGKGRRINDDYFLEKVCVCHPQKKNTPTRLCLAAFLRMLRHALISRLFNSSTFSPCSTKCLNAFELFKGEENANAIIVHTASLYARELPEEICHVLIAGALRSQT